MAKGSKVEAVFLFSGMIDYWGGDGDRWADDAGCLFSAYGPETTMRELFDGWVDSFNNDGECDDAPWYQVTDDEVKRALRAMLTTQARAELDNPDAGPCALAHDLDASEFDDDGDGEWPMTVVLVTVDRDTD